MRQKTKDLISDLILEEIKECHDTRLAVRRIVREEIASIREKLGMEYNEYYLRGYGFGGDVTPPDKASGAWAIENIKSDIRGCEEFLRKLKLILKQELKIDFDNYIYQTETKLVKKED